MHHDMDGCGGAVQEQEDRFLNFLHILCSSTIGTVVYYCTVYTTVHTVYSTVYVKGHLQ